MERPGRESTYLYTLIYLKLTRSPFLISGRKPISILTSCSSNISSALLRKLVQGRGLKIHRGCSGSVGQSDNGDSEVELHICNCWQNSNPENDCILIERVVDLQREWNMREWIPVDMRKEIKEETREPSHIGPQELPPPSRDPKLPVPYSGEMFPG